MNTTKQHREQQEAKQLQSEISSFIDVDNQVSTLNKSTSQIERGIFSDTVISKFYTGVSEIISPRPANPL
jgi:hypothetical protein